jgi:hypothetical protein
VCRVTAAQSFDVGDGISQILKLEPLTGPWPAGTQLIRLDGTVLPVRTRGLWRAGARRRTIRRAAAGRHPLRGAEHRAAG